MLEKKEQPCRCAAYQARFVHHIAEGNAETAADEGGVCFLKNRKIDLFVYFPWRIVQQVVFSDFRIAEKGFEHRVVRLLLRLAGIGHENGRLGKRK